jgi:hypothetical protein
VKSVFLSLAFEGGFGSKEDIEDNTTTPKITSISKVAFDDFWRHIADSANKFMAFHFRTNKPTSSAKVK